MSEYTDERAKLVAAHGEDDRAVTYLDLDEAVQILLELRYEFGDEYAGRDRLDEFLAIQVRP